MNIHIHINGKAKDANPDGTVSENEGKERKILVNKARAIKDELKREAYKIGGSFRGPGIWSDVLEVFKSR